jgi:hypothetical protein
MRKLRVGIIDLVAKKREGGLWARVMNANFASIMPQALGVWCERQGHDVTYVCYTGEGDVADCVPGDLDIALIGAFTEAAHMAYALSAYLRSRGTVTAIGGPHARCYPQDAQRYFDYVFGFTDEEVLFEVLNDCAPHRPVGVRVGAEQQPAAIPGVRERWKFIEPTLRRAPFIKMVPMLGSLGCPYKCAFCIDSTVPYQPLDAASLREDLTFLRTKFRRPLVAWHDPNFGVQFEQAMHAIESAAPPDSIDFAAESSLSILSEPHLVRMKRNGFKVLLPGVESWFALGEKARTGSVTGMAKVRQVADHVNLILRYVPYIQTNFVLGLDTDTGAEPFELTKKFIDLAPGAFPGYSLLSAFGQAAPLNLEYQRDGRVLPFPFHFLNNNESMNVRPRNYAWPEFYARVADLTAHSFRPRAIARRFAATHATVPRWLNIVRAVSTEGYGRLAMYREMQGRLAEDRGLRAFMDQESTEVPASYFDTIRLQLGKMAQWLPEGGMLHDPLAYLKEEEEKSAAGVRVAVAG